MHTHKRSNTKSKDDLRSRVKDVANDATVQTAIAEIKRALSSAAKHDLGSKYVVGEKVHQIRTSTPNKKYGTRAVATIAREVKVSAACLYQYADVARTWSKGAFDDVGLRAAKVGLMFSHFIELAHPDHAGQRDARLERAIEGRLSVRALRAMRAGVRKTLREGHTDALERFKAEGPSEELGALIEEALKAARLAHEKIEERIHNLEKARVECVTSDETSGALPDNQKAAE